MHSHLEISLDSIAGIVPKSSTYGDVLRLLGSNYEIELRPGEQLTRNLLPAKSLLHYPTTGIVVVFIDPGGELLPEAHVSIVGVEGGPLRTADGLHVGMQMADAEEIITANYRVQHRSSFCVEIVSADRKSPNFLAVYEEDGKVAFLGLHRKD